MAEGYERLGGPNEQADAVAWWYYREIGEGVVFARGGFVRKSRDARREIDACRQQDAHLARRIERRPRFALGKEGELIPLPYVGAKT